MSQASSKTSGGGGGGTVTSIAAGTGITLTPNPIIGTGTVALTIPVTIADGGTNATSMTNTDGVVYFDGTRLVTTAVGTATFVLTSNGIGVAPTFQAAAGGSGIVTIDGDSGSVTGATVTFQASGQAGSSVSFSGTAAIMSLNTLDANNNCIIGGGNGSIVGDGGSGNVGQGYLTFLELTSGSNNQAIGYESLALLLTGSGNLCIGSRSGFAYTSSESNNILLGCLTEGTIGDENTLRIGSGTGTGTGNLNQSFISGIQGITVTGAAVLVSGSDQLGVAVSSERFKENIRKMPSVTNQIMALNPVTFNYKVGEDKSTQYGLIAEHVQQVMPQLVILDKQGLPQTVKYHDLPVLLLAEIQKHREELDRLRSELDALKKGE